MVVCTLESQIQKQNESKISVLETTRISTVGDPKEPVGPVGLEPTTHGLKVRCSTN